MFRSYQPFLKKIHVTAFLVVLLSVLLPAVSWASAAIAQTYLPASDELWIKIDKSRMQLTLRRGTSEVLNSYPVATGRREGVKKSRTDMITPVGVFTIWRVIQDATQLVYDPKWFNEPGPPQKGVYGAKLISFYNPWEIALHGTSSPNSIGKRVTHGCIRMYNKDIIALSKSVKPGMRMWIVDRDVPIVEKDSI